MRILAAVSGEAPDGVRLFTVGLLCALSSAGHTACAAFSGGVPDEISKSGVHIVRIQNGSEYRTLKALITDGEFDAVCSFDECLGLKIIRIFASSRPRSRLRGKRYAGNARSSCPQMMRTVLRYAAACHMIR